MLIGSFGLSVRIVAPTEVERALKEYDETEGIPVFENVAKAREALA